MHQRSQISLCKLLCRHSVYRSPKPTYPSSINSVAKIRHYRVSDSFSQPQEFSSEPATYFHRFQFTIALVNPQILRRYSNSTGGSVAEFDQDREVDMINIKFAEAREEIEMALESKETVYFNEEAECARAAVKEVLEMYEGLLAKLPENDRTALQRSMGLKIEQLKAELQQLDE